MIFLTLILLLVCCSPIQSQESVDTSAFLFDYTYAIWVRLPEGVGFEPDYTSRDSLDFHKSVQIDLDEDGVPENLWVNLCGTGGCVYTIQSGRSGEYFGEIFGNPVIVRKQRINSLPVIQTYSHASAGSGDFNCYIFDGKAYVRASTILLLKETVRSFFQSLRRVPWLQKK